MGYATRVALGCNIGSFFGAVASFSLHGWVFGVFVMVGAWIGSKLLDLNSLCKAGIGFVNYREKAKAMERKPSTMMSDYWRGGGAAGG